MNSSITPINSQKGFSLVELLLVLGVIALIAIAAFIIYPSVQAGTQANTESSNITSIVAGTKNLYGSVGNYSGVTNQQLCEARIFPSTMVGGATGGACATATPKSVWANDVDVTVGANTATFDIAYTGIPTESCIKFVSGVAANFNEVGVAGTPDSIKAEGEAPSAAAIVAACQGDGTVADIIFNSK